MANNRQKESPKKRQEMTPEEKDKARPENAGSDNSECQEKPETEEQILTKNTGEPQEERRPG